MSNKYKSAVLFSGGKDSCLALYYALQSSEVKCLIIMHSNNPESYMFHTPNIRWAVVQAECIGLPVIVQETDGVKEDELKDLESAISKAVTDFGIDSLYTGAIASVYQASRIKKICDKMGLICNDPLWNKDQVMLLQELVDKSFDVLIVGTFGEGLNRFLGRIIDENFIKDIEEVKDIYGINPAGEGGEFESFVLNAPYFKRKIVLKDSHIVKDTSGGQVLVIDSIDTRDKC